MKNVITSSLLLLALLLPASAAAYDFEEGGIYYNYCNNPDSSDYVVEVTSPPRADNYAGTVIIPAAVTHDGITYSVISIGKRAFYWCNNLKSVVVPNSVTTIGDNAFDECIRLENVNIPNSVTSIGKWAFSSCNLTSVTIPASVTSIGENAFVWCANLANLAVESSNTRYDSRDDCNAIIETASNTLITGCQNTVIPNSVIAIGAGAFQGCHTLENITIPNSIVSIGNYAFYACDLKSITIGPSLTSIGERVFTYCNLARIVVDSGNTTFDSRDDCNAIIETASNTLVVGGQNTIIPNTVTTIGSYAFSGCSNLISMTIPNSVTSIGTNVFQYCTGLENVTIPNSITWIPGYVFADCSSLTNVTIPNTVTTISSYAFYNCTGLTSITIPHSVTTIGWYAFSNCSNLKDVYTYITDPLSVDVGNYVFKKYNDDYSGCTLHVPYGTVYAYQADEHWFPYFEQIVELEPGMELIGDVNFDGQVDIADINAIMDIILGIDVYASEADVNRDGEVTIADINAIMDIILGGNEQSWPEHEYVDLGLTSGTLWATCNIGANSPEEYGDYFAWGETEPKEVYNESTYKWSDGHYHLTKYCTDSRWGTVDNKTKLDREDDAAWVNWGPSWHMPSLEQIEELYAECSHQLTQVNGVKGHLMTGSNGNSIFLPAAGYRNDSYLVEAGSGGFYWQSWLDINNGTAFCMNFDWGWGWGDRTRRHGLSVRAVRVTPDDNQSLYIEQPFLDLGEVPMGKTCTSQLTIINDTWEDMTLTATADEPFLFERNGACARNMTIVVPSNTFANVTVMFEATTLGEYNGNVTFQNPALEGGQSVIPVHVRAITDAASQQEYVDLGLPSGTLWATCNVGATSPEEYGDLFAWGETEPKATYTWETYKWCHGSYNSLTKYCNNSSYGNVDGRTELELEDDAAYVNMGPSWRMPSIEQMHELMDNCTSHNATRNGVKGQLLIGPNGNTMFMPIRDEYWSRTVSTQFYAHEFGYSIDKWNFYGGPRCNGDAVRAVRVSQE